MKCKPIRCIPAGCCDHELPTSSNKRSGRCSSPTTPSASSSPKPPTTWERTPTDIPSPEQSTSSAARYSTRRRFPPSTLTAAIRETITEIQERPLAARRYRTCPHKARRRTIVTKEIKHAEDQIINHDGPPVIHIFRPLVA